MGYLQRGACVAVLCCVTLVWLCGADEGRFPTTCANRTIFNIDATDLQSRPFTFECPEPLDQMITEVWIVGVTDTCLGSSSLLQSIEKECSWHKTCTLDTLVADTVIEVDDSNGACLGQRPTSFQLAYNCMRKNRGVVDVLGNFQTTTRRWGLAKSHNLFPSSYRNGQEMGNLTIVRPKRPFDQELNLWVTVKTLSLLDSDQLFFTKVNGEQLMVRSPPNSPAQGTFWMDDLRQVTLTMMVDTTAQHSAVGDGDGFVLCYQWLPVGEIPVHNSACTKLMGPAKCPMVYADA